MPKPVTILDIAREAGVSPTLVSFVFNGKNRVGAATRQRVLDVAARMGYRTAVPAREEWPAARLIGLLVADDLPSGAAWAEAFSRCAYRRGYTVVAASALGDPVHIGHLLRAFGQPAFRGIVLSRPFQASEEDCLRTLMATQKPYVFPGTSPEQTLQELLQQI